MGECGTYSEGETEEKGIEMEPACRTGPAHAFLVSLLLVLVNFFGNFKITFRLNYYWVEEKALFFFI